MSRREEILQGNLTFPEQIMDIVNPTKDELLSDLINDFWANIWHNFLQEKTVNTVLWMVRFDNKKLFNSLLTHLSQAGWITSSVEVKYAFIELNKSKLLKWITEEEILNVKFQYKTNKYRLQDTKSTLYSVVQQNGKHIETGLIRKGFMKAGNNKFRYDTKYLSIYLECIAQNVQKGLSASTKDITYQEIIDELLDWYSVDGTEYTLGKCLIDSRGRSIFQCSRKVFNPVSCKDARALLICEPQPLTNDGFDTVYAAIAELNGYRGTNINDKIETGLTMYLLREMPDLSKMVEENNFDDLHIRIWLERIYENLDNYDTNGNNWYVPIEIDALASLIQLMGVLTNDYNFMVGTNLIETEEGFQDIWTVPYVSRTHIKKVMTPTLYGSSKHPRQLWDSNKLEYTQKQLNQVAEELTNGIFANATDFKNHIINNVKPEVRMKVEIFGEKFWIECNRFKWEETTVISYWVYTSQQGIMKRTDRKLNLVPDPNQFKRYFVTLLLHNLDSQIADKICQLVDWVLPNHDAFTIHPNASREVRRIYTECMYNIWSCRREILKTFFKSIGIDKEYEEMSYPEGHLLNSVDEKGYHKLKEFSPYCLK